MKVEKDMIFRGKVNGRKIKILRVSNENVTYQDLLAMTVFTVGRKAFEHFLIEEVNNG